eukprot:symbB.v1.2.020158.t1/scaffold1649.1/size108312/1
MDGDHGDESHGINTKSRAAHTGQRPSGGLASGLALGVHILLRIFNDFGKVIKQRSPFAADETKQLVDMAVPLLRAEHDVLGEAVAMHGLVRELGGMVG